MLRDDFLSYDKYFLDELHDNYDVKIPEGIRMQIWIFFRKRAIVKKCKTDLIRVNNSVWMKNEKNIGILKSGILVIFCVPSVMRSI